MQIHRGSQELILNSKILLDIDITMQFKIQSDILTLDSVQNSIQNHLPERDPTWNSSIIYWLKITQSLHTNQSLQP